MSFTFEFSRNIRTVLFRIVALAVLGTLIGVVVSLFALAFLESISWLNKIFLVSPHARIQHEENTWIVVSATILVPTLGGLLVGLIIRYSVNEKRPLGPPDTILIVQTRSKINSIRSGLMSTLASIVSLGAGASVGQYGPLVYLGTLVGAVASKLKLDIHNLQAICIASGVAAAISAAFNAPIAGLVFAHEVILRHYSIQAFAPTTVAAATGFVVANVVFERPPLFLVQFEGIQFGYEFVLFAIVGIMSALLAVVYAKGILACGALANRMPIPSFLHPMIAGLVLGLVAIELPDVLGIGKETLRFATIDGAFEIGELTLIIAAKLGVTVLCLGFGFAGGVFSPILLIGILFGALFGSVLDGFTTIQHSGVTPYAICGMMAATSPVIGAPLATILIVFELTRSYDLTIAAMVAVVFSNLIAYRIFGRSIYDVQLSRRGFDLSLGRTQAIVAYQLISTLMRPVTLRFNPQDSIAEVMAKLMENEKSEGIVTDDGNRFVGIVRVQACVKHDQSKPVGDIIDQNTLKFNESTNVREAVNAFRHFTGEIAPVVSSDGQVLLGFVSDRDVIDAYQATVERLRREENESI